MEKSTTIKIELDDEMSYGLQQLLKSLIKSMRDTIRYEEIEKEAYFFYDLDRMYGREIWHPYFVQYLPFVMKR